MSDSPLVEASKPSLVQRIKWKFDDFKRTIRINVRDKLIKFIGGVPADFDSNYLSHARRELLGCKPDADEMDKLMADQVLQLLAVFGTHGHSGFSAPFAISLFSNLAAFKPLGPLTGEDDEWELLDYTNDVTYQNKRAGHIFKGADGIAYDSNGRVFKDPNGSCWTGSGSRVEITFPYVPTIEYVDVDVNGDPIK